jgi:hypothetical protein
VYPPKNLSTEAGSGRPDFVVRDAVTQEVLAWIESECWSNQEQLDRYRRIYRERIVALWGKPGPECDLSLQEVSAFLGREANDFDQQTRVNAEHLRGLIGEISEYGSRGSKTAAVGDEMRNSTFLVALASKLGSRLYYYQDGDRMTPGRVRVDTTDSENNRGFSIGVYSPNTPKRRVSIMNRSAGRPFLSFSSKAWLYHYLPGHRAVVDEWCKFAWTLGADLEGIDSVSERGGRPTGNKTVAVNLERVESQIDAIVGFLSRFSDRPTR